MNQTVSSSGRLVSRRFPECLSRMLSAGPHLRVQCDCRRQHGLVGHLNVGAHGFFWLAILYTPLSLIRKPVLSTRLWIILLLDKFHRFCSGFIPDFRLSFPIKGFLIKGEGVYSMFVRSASVLTFCLKSGPVLSGPSPYLGYQDPVCMDVISLQLLCQDFMFV